jgi:predicted RND superfamily exporter protein
VSNSVLLVTFMDEHWKGGASSTEAAIVGAGERLRPILMTACAMTVGMVPMALALERGSQMQAPLGRAVIGGLVMSTFATLLFVPSIFAIVIGKQVARSPSIYPNDPESTHYDPNVYAGEEHADPHHSHGDGHSHSPAGGRESGSTPEEPPNATPLPGEH